jgi:hypothetical protein
VYDIRTEHTDSHIGRRVKGNREPHTGRGPLIWISQRGIAGAEQWPGKQAPEAPLTALP